MHRQLGPQSAAVRVSFLESEPHQPFREADNSVGGVGGEGGGH